MKSNDQIIYDVARRNGYDDTTAKLIVAQSRFESADYTSPVFRNNFNTSGMKFIGQPLATRGTLVPFEERSAECQRGGRCRNDDHYAKFKSVEDSAKDKIERLFNITRNGITTQDIKNTKTPLEFATIQKKRNYYGSVDWNTAKGQAEIKNYAGGMLAKLSKINVVEFVKKNPKSSAFVTILVIGLIAYGVYAYKKAKKNK